MDVGVFLREDTERGHLCTAERAERVANEVLNTLNDNWRR